MYRRKLPLMGSAFAGIGIIVSLLFNNLAFAANTHSIDLEHSSTQFLSIADGSQTGLDLTGDFTLETWIKLESVPGTDENRAIMTKYLRSGEQRSFNFQLRNSGGTSQLLLSVSSDGTGGNTSDQVVTWSPSTNTWYHVAVTYDVSAGEATFYVNGVQQGSTQTGGKTSIYDGAGNFEIGGNDGDEGSNAFDGLIDDARVWNVLKTATEIADDRARELNGNETGLVGYWKLNNSLSDLSGHGNTLTNPNSASFSMDAPFGTFTEVLKVRKSASENVTSSTVLQNDDHLKLSLDSNKTYIIDGVVFASSSSATPDLVLGFFGQSDSVITIGYTNDTNEMVLGSGATSTRITLPANTPTSIHIHGTVKTGTTSGDLQLKWAQATSNGSATTVMEGSYLRADAI